MITNDVENEKSVSPVSGDELEENAVAVGSVEFILNDVGNGGVEDEVVVVVVVVAGVGKAAGAGVELEDSELVLLNENAEVEVELAPATGAFEELLLEL